MSNNQLIEGFCRTLHGKILEKDDTATLHVEQTTILDGGFIPRQCLVVTISTSTGIDVYNIMLDDFTWSRVVHMS